MQYIDSPRRVPGQASRIPPLTQALPPMADHTAMMMTRYRVPFQGHGEIFPAHHPPNPVLMRQTLPHHEKDQAFHPQFQSLSPGDAEALYNCMDPKLWAESMINPMMLPPMFDSYYNGLDFHAPGYRKNVTKETTGPLKAWLQDHRKNPYPTKAEKIMLAIITKMTLTQVSTWFANARRRLKKETGSTIGDDGDEKSITDDEDDIGDSQTKTDSENEADYEISVDSDDEHEVDILDTKTGNGTTPMSMVSSTTEGHSFTIRRPFMRDHARSRAFPYQLPHRNVHKEPSSTTVPVHIQSGPLSESETSKFISKRIDDNSTDIKPVDLSPGQRVLPAQNHQQQQRTDGTPRQHQIDLPEVNQMPSNSQNSKAKIWSISNILNMDSTKPT